MIPENQWEDIVIRNPNNKKRVNEKQTNAPPKVSKDGLIEKKIESGEDILKQTSKSLRTVFIERRTGSGYNQTQLAQKINERPDVIRDLESGKLPETKAKQIIIKCERHIGKILSKK